MDNHNENNNLKKTEDDWPWYRIHYFNEVKSEFLSVAVVSTFNILAIYSTMHIFPTGI